MFEVARCKTCGRPYHVPRVNGFVGPRILKMLEARPDGVSLEDIAASIYASKRNGGPRWGHESIKAIIHRMRKQLAPYGWTIKSTLGPGAVYRLVSVAPTR